MTLAQLSPLYQESAAAIAQRIKQLQAQLLEEMDEEAAFQLRQRIRELQPLLRQTRELAELTAHYYERSRSRNDKYTL